MTRKSFMTLVVLGWAAFILGQLMSGDSPRRAVLKVVLLAVARALPQALLP